MPGEVRDVRAWLDRADLLVSSSRWEGLQAAPIEALAAGCPVVATDCPGGARETLDGGRLGILVPVRDAAAMARAMRAQLDHPPDPHSLAAGAARFLPDGKAEQYLRLFDSLRGD
jgi:glycosyltransferase involved in cell wall biosynthesis